MFYFFFDDSELARDPKSEIGLILQNEEEVEQVAMLCGALEAMLNRLGDKDSRAFMDDGQWGSVVQLAGSALEKIKRPRL